MDVPPEAVLFDMMGNPMVIDAAPGPLTFTANENPCYLTLGL